MSRGFRRAAVALAAVLLVSACGDGSRPDPEGGADRASASPPKPTGLLLLAADAAGAIALDRDADALVGFDPAGRRVWTDPDALEQGATAVCLDRCASAVVSGGNGSDRPDPAPRAFVAGRAAPFAVPAAPHRRVLTARSATDAVVEEGDGTGRSYLHVLRPDGDRRIPVAASDYAWAESPDHATALALSRRPEAGDARLLRFVREPVGWRLADDTAPRGRIWDACVSAGGRLAVLVGPEAGVLRDGAGRQPLRTDLVSAGECAVGATGGVVIQRSNDSAGKVRTAVRGIGADGAQTWSADYPGEATVTADPTGSRTAVASDGTLRLLDATGKTVTSRPGIRSALFTPDGVLVTAATDGAVRWERLGR